MFGEVSLPKVFTNVLKQCKETTKNYEGPEETLKHILKVEGRLKRLFSELN
jgi:hypothetical protein